jgi:hypothetical protein
MLMAPALADELKLIPSIDVQARVDNNPLLRIQGAKPILIGQMTPQLKLNQRNDRLDYSLTALVNLRAYAGWDNTSSDDERAALNANYSTSERSRLGLAASLDRVTLLDALEDNTGRFTRPARVTTTSIAPNAALLVNPVDEVGVAGFITNKTYDSPQLQNFRQYGASLRWSRALSEVDSGSILVSAARVDPANALIAATEVYSAILALSHKLPGGLRVSASAGPQIVRRIRPPGTVGKSKDETGYEADVSLSNPIDELTTMTIDFSHQAQPNGTAGVSQRNSIRLSGQRRLSPVLTLNLSANLTTSDASGLNADTLRDLFGANVGLNWQLSYVSKLSLGYYHRSQTFRTVAGTASSDGLYLTFSQTLGDRQQ